MWGGCYTTYLDLVWVLFGILRVYTIRGGPYKASSSWIWGFPFTSLGLLPGFFRVYRFMMVVTCPFCTSLDL